MIVLILAAGYATRLYPLTLNTPKPLLKVGGRPIIERIFDKISGVGEVTKCIVVTNQKFFDSFSRWAAEFRFSAPIEVINDKTTSNETRLGAIRDIEFVLRDKGIKDDLLVIGGDNLFEFSLREFVDFAKSRGAGAALALFDINDITKAGLYGVVRVDASGRIVDFSEKPPKPQSTLIATCVYYFSRDKINRISEYLKGGQKNDAPGNYIKWLSETDKVYGFIFKGRWYDIGDIASYKKADGEYQ